MKLPYIVAKSDFLKRRFREIVKKYCQNKISLKFIFTTYKIGYYFSAKLFLKCLYLVLFMNLTVLATVLEAPDGVWRDAG